MKSEKRYYSGTAEELLNDPYELRLYMTKMDREHKAEVEELKKEIKRLKAENKDLKNKKVHYNQDKSGGYIII